MAPRCTQLFVLSILLASVSCGDSQNPNEVDAPAVDADSRDVLARLNALPGVVANEFATDVPGYRAFSLRFDQPVDHQNPATQRFTQFATLLHRDAGAPLIVATTGYWDYIRDRRVELTRLVEGNQISIEHRYFNQSRPIPADWTQLTVANAAADQHRIIAALRTIYTSAVATTGASKGGMTAVYHRRFYPDDVVAAFPYVAPQSSSDQDPRYMQFLTTVGTQPCRDAIRAVQVELLTNRRAMLLQRTNQQAMQQGAQFTRIAPAAVVEAVVASLDWAFWQYRGIDDCPRVPATAASDDAMWTFLEQTAPVSDNTDDELALFEPYYYQAAFQLGQPTSQPPHLASLLQFTGVDYGGLLPLGVAAPTYQPSAMQDIDSWLQQAGQRMMFIYGEWDPWTAAPFTLGNAVDSFVFVQAKGTHGANLAGLAASDRSTAATKIGAWLGVTPAGLTANKPQVFEAVPREPRMPAAIVHSSRLAKPHRDGAEPVLHDLHE